MRSENASPRAERGTLLRRGHPGRQHAYEPCGRRRGKLGDRCSKARSMADAVGRLRHRRPATLSPIPCSHGFNIWRHKIWDAPRPLTHNISSQGSRIQRAGQCRTVRCLTLKIQRTLGPSNAASKGKWHNRLTNRAGEKLGRVYVCHGRQRSGKERGRHHEIRGSLDR